MSKSNSSSLLIAIIVSLGGFVFGFDASVISGVVGYVSNEFSLNAWETGIIVAAPTLGGFIASFIAGPLADQIGRRKVLIIIAALYAVSALCSAFAPTFQLLAFARFVGGLAFVSLMLAPMYIAEVSPPNLRGKRVAINQLNIVVGFSAAYFANYLFLQLSQSQYGWIESLGLNQHTWRWMLGIETIPALFYLICLFFVPESPRWLVLKNREVEARNVWQKLNITENIQAQIQQVKDSVCSNEVPFASRVKQLFDKRMRLVITIGVIAGIAQQITGVNAVYFYAPTIFEQSGVGTNAAFSQAVWVGIINVIFTIAAMVLIDKIGRRPLMILGLAGVLVSMSICSFGFYQASYKLTAEKVDTLVSNNKESKQSWSSLTSLVGKRYENDVEYKNALKDALGADTFKKNESELIKAGISINSTIVLFGILGFVASFAISLGPVMWVLLSEIFPNQIRGIAISFVAVINAAVSFNVQLIFPWELEFLGAAPTFFIYGAFALIGMLLMMWLLPETKGKSLEELEAELTRTSEKTSGISQKDVTAS